MSTRAEIESMLDDCEVRSEKLNDFELKIIASFRDYFDRGNFLSEKQDALLEKIWDGVTR